MSVLIKGMKLPKAGQILEVAENVDGTILIREIMQGKWHYATEIIDRIELDDDCISREA